MKTLLHNATIAPMQGTGDFIRHRQDIIINDGKIAAVHPTRPLSDYTDIAAENRFQLEEKLVTPGLIDCHTHLVFGGNRADEWEKRLNGVPYTDIAKAGGGINATVSATRQTDEKQLYKTSAKRLQALIAEGVTTVECKSGYGLNLQAEEKQLQIATQLGQDFPVTIKRTLLSAHTVPPEYRDNPDDYIDLICKDIMPTLHDKGLVDAVDVFCESVGFSIAQTRRVFERARALGIPVKGHTEQLSNLGGSALVAEFDGLSADHIEYLDEAGVIAMKQHGTVATLLPLAFYFLRETQVPPIDLLRKHRVPMAVSTDFNPGTAPLASLRLAMNMACTQFQLTPAEVWLGVTKHAAQALGLQNSHGQIKTGYVADLAVWDVKLPVEVIYELGVNPLYHRFHQGRLDGGKGDKAKN